MHMQNYFHQADIHRQVRAMLQIGTVYAFEPADNTAQIQLTDTLISDFLPLPAHYGHCFSAHMPVAVGATALIAAEGGNTGNAVIVAVYHNQENKPLSGSLDQVIFTFIDGSKIAIDTSAKTIDITAAGDLTANVSGNAIINGQQVTINDSNASGVVNGKCICAFTGNPHPHVSQTVFAGGA